MRSGWATIRLWDGRRAVPVSIWAELGWLFWVADGAEGAIICAPETYIYLCKAAG